MLAGWYDCFLPYTLADYTRLREAGKAPYLTIGPWTHTDESSFKVSLGDSIAFFRAHLLGDRSALRESPVRLYLMGANEWRDFPDWPPPGQKPQRWYLQAHGGLSTEAPGKSEPDRYRYDPADPTPGVGGGSLSKNCGPMDNRELESRRDVLVFTSEPMQADLDVIGPISVEVYVRSSLEHTDFFAKLCDVDPSGKSTNLCDGILRLSPGSLPAEPDGTKKVVIRLWPTANRFRSGHRIRVHVSSGAHPRFARNLGTGEPLASGTNMLAAEQTVYHDPEHPSAVVLPVLSR
jgi:putative CocE/NonD family hydrolase